ncbi:hypothetical protein GCM10010331_71800 [Streptomyces xanthochromogenes]|uniref:hypothetical protein n=1 Tax=Streptomyces xanthochromogenes TaxID=67384 RepID=UPI001673F12E|nr:hypothetical protein [Streptomyces xanthochromogenes]GHB73458.1 hypothetical protein GCM10010331_71800 [Streptomyces xanthochromogenes]
MQTTAHTLKQAWHQVVVGSDVLDDALFPLIGTSPDEYEQRVGDPDGALFLVLDDDGMVRGHIGPYREVFATRDLDLVLYFVAEEAVQRLAEHTTTSPGHGEETELVARQAELLDRIDPAWGGRFRSGGVDAEQSGAPLQPCGRDPLEGLAWIAGGWREQDPYTHLAFFRGDNISAEQIALLYGADPAQIAAGTRLADLGGADGGTRDFWDIGWETCCFGHAGGWAYLMYHEVPDYGPGPEALARLGVTETVELSATSAKAIYTFDYMRDGRRVDDDWGILELIWYKRGRAPYFRGGQLDFLNRAVRRAELDHPELTSEFELYFHALEDALGIQLPRQEIEQGGVRAAQWAQQS